MTDHDTESFEEIKLVSRVKHTILQKYLPAWERILGSAYNSLSYVDCYAGPGVYKLDGEIVDGSPVIAAKTAIDYLSRNPSKRMNLYFVDDDENHRRTLDARLGELRPFPEQLKVEVIAGDAKDEVPNLLTKASSLGPAFFFVDPYGHPLTIPILNRILRLPRTEALINFMWFRVNMDASNSVKEHLVDEMFGDQDWRLQPFLREVGHKRETGFLEYFERKITAKYKRHFRIRYDPSDATHADRTKYYLIHTCNHPKADLLMKEVMWPLGDEEGLFDFSGDTHLRLFSSSPDRAELRKILLAKFLGREKEFDEIRLETREEPFVEKEYRAVINGLMEEGKVVKIPVSSKTAKGLKGRDRVRFLA